MSNTSREEREEVFAYSIASEHGIHVCLFRPSIALPGLTRSLFKVDQGTTGYLRSRYL